MQSDLRPKLAPAKFQKVLYPFNSQQIKKYPSFIYSPTDALVSCLKKKILKFTSKFYITTAPTCFGVTVTPKHVGAVIM